MATKARKLPTMRRQYHSIFGLDSGLDYSSPSTMIAETNTPNCEEVTFRDKVVGKAYGTDFFAHTDTTVLLGTMMLAKQYIKNNESEKFLVHTSKNIYLYNTTSELLECITEGVVVENCEDVWTPVSPVTCTLSTSARSGAISGAADNGSDKVRYETGDVHGLLIGDEVTVVGMGEETYNVLQTVTEVSDTTHFDSALTYVTNVDEVGTYSAEYSIAVRKGTYSVRVAIPAAGFTTGVAVYEAITLDASTYDHLHFYIKSNVDTDAGQLQIRLSDAEEGAETGDAWADYDVPALEAGVWQEVSVALNDPAETHDGITCPDDLTTIISIALMVVTDIGAQVVTIDDVMCTIEMSGDEDNNMVVAVVNDYYIFSNATDPLYYWYMDDATVTKVDGGGSLGCKAMQLIGERLNLYGLPDLPRRVGWTIVGGLHTPPVAADWTDPGSGDTDLDSVFGEDVIMTAHKLGNYVVIYGKKTIAMQEYTGKTPTDPYAFYVRVAGTGTPSERGVANLGDSHIVLTWDDVVIYKGGTDVQSIGDKVSRELFNLINPTYIHRSFMVYLDEQYEVRLYFPLIGSTVPNCYFTYSLDNGSWSRGSRSYTGFGPYKRIEGADTWDTTGTETTTWDELILRWNDTTNEILSPLNIYGDSNGIVYKDNESTLNNAGVAIDGYWDTKDFVIGDGYRRRTTNWMSLGFEATGDTVTVYYSTDLGENWSEGVEFTLTSVWVKYRYDINVNSPQVRFRFRNAVLNETFQVRELELGYIEASDRGTV